MVTGLVPSHIDISKVPIKYATKIGNLITRYLIISYDA